MKCPACHADLPLGSKFCPKCGAKLAEPPETSETALDRFKGKLTAQSNATNDEETLLWKGGYSPKAMVNYWVVALLVTVGLIVGGVLFPPAGWLVAAIGVIALWGSLLLYLLYLRLSIEYELTNQRFIHRTGILRRVTNRIEVIDIDDVQYEQSFIDRFLGVGTIRILSSDVSDPKLILVGIDDVKHVWELMDRCRRDERKRRGLHIETV
jgi:uncharacterized membrane protein YdbT with pleckstrin-like domain